MIILTSLTKGLREISNILNLNELPRSHRTGIINESKQRYCVSAAVLLNLIPEFSLARHKWVLSNPSNRFCVFLISTRCRKLAMDLSWIWNCSNHCNMNPNLMYFKINLQNSNFCFGSMFWSHVWLQSCVVKDWLLILWIIAVCFVLFVFPTFSISLRYCGEIVKLKCSAWVNGFSMSEQAICCKSHDILNTARENWKYISENSI